MQPFIRHQGVAAPLLKPNIDTDAIIPSREMRQVSKQGLAAGLFANWRYRDAASRRPDADFVLNQPCYAGASILLGGPNFGCGSSREHAVWALAEFGVRAIIAPSFGAIFQKNCVANGVLPAAASEAAVRLAATWVEQDPQGNRPLLDLSNRTIRAGARMSFSIRNADRLRLMQGLDPIAYTLTRSERIDAFERQRQQTHPWAKLS